MLKRQSLLLYAIGCIISVVPLMGAGAPTAMMGARSVHLTPATSVELQPLHLLAVGGDSGSPSYLFQLASGSTNAAPNRPSPYSSCPGGVNPDVPKPHDGGGGKKKIPGPLVTPCAPAGGRVARG
jgi:hypothetical protein